MMTDYPTHTFAGFHVQVRYNRNPWTPEEGGQIFYHDKLIAAWHPQGAGTTTLLAAVTDANDRIYESRLIPDNVETQHQPFTPPEPD